MGSKLKRRDAMALAVTAAVVTLLKLEEDRMRVDSKEVTSEEMDVAKEAIAIFCGSFPAGTEPSPEQAAEKGRLAIRAWRKLDES
jgi:hypothetical protein